MKKQIKSLSELKNSALSRGASLDIGGEKFNSNHDKVAVARRLPEPVAQVKVEIPVAPVAPESRESRESQAATPVNVDMAPVAKAIEDSQGKMGQLIADALKNIPSAPQVSGATPTSWVFKINRDTRGYIETVEATPK